MSGEPSKQWSKRVRRALLYAAGGASLVVLVASLAAWTWFGRDGYGIRYVRPGGQVNAGAFERVFVIELRLVTWPMYPEWSIERGNFFIDMDGDVGGEIDKKVTLLGAGDTAVRAITRTYASDSGKSPYTSREYGAWLPYWLLALLATPLPLWIVTRHRRALIRERRRARGQCETCGYDLRATPGRCPECGTAAPSVWARVRSWFAGRRKVGRAGIEPATHGFSVHCSTS